MSGDVQPRKRKDKKKKRDDDEPKEKSPSGVHATKMGPDDLQLHVHSDHGTGGHWCAKILFFSLMAVLVGLIGLILLEHRGISDLDTPLSESRFAEYLEGWVDEKRESHDDHDVLESLHDELDELDEHGDEPFEEEETGHDDDDDDDHDQEDDSNEEEEEDDEANHDEDDTQENGNDNTADDDDDDNDDDDDDTPREEADDQNDEDDDSRQDDSDNRNEEEEDDSKEENDNVDGEGDDSAGDLSENDDNDDADDNEIEKDDNDDTDEGFEDQIGDDDIDTDDNSPFEEENDSDDASDEQFIDNDQGEDLHLQKLSEKEAAEQQNEEDEQDASSSLTVKLGVGLALVVVAHLVLVKRSKSNEEEKTDSPPVEPVDLKRRFTLITSTEPIPSDVDDEQPNEEDDEYEDDDLKDGDADADEADDLKEGDEGNEEEIVEDDENDEEYEDENENSENSAESEEEIEDIENVGEEVDTVDTFTEMKNMYRPKNKQSFGNDEEVDAKVESKDDIDLGESDAEEDIEGSENSEDIEEEEEEDEEEEEISDVDDEDLMKRLESKYGKLPEMKNSSDEEETDEKWTKVKRSAAQQNDDDFEDELRRTNEMLYDNPTSALKSFDALIEIKPNSPKAWYGKGTALDKLSEEQKSNEILKEAIAAYVKAVEFGSSVDDETYKIMAERCIERMRFIGQHLKAVPLHEALIERFNDDPYYRNQLAVTYLLINRLADAKLVLHETLLRWRHDGFALVHYGFVLKNFDKNNEAAVSFLQEGIDTDAEGTNDGRFYFNLGEALTRLGRNEEAMAVYRKGASKKLFLSAYQRSLYNVDRLKSRPFWTKKQTGYKQHLDVLQQNWEKIRDEGLSVLNDRGHFTDEAENLRDVGDWKQFDLFARGRKIAAHCAKTPFTCKIIETFPAARFCKRGQVKFSVMHPGTHVWPHCGPTNCRIRAHLGLKVPEKTFIRVATQTRSWSEGELLIFDDSFEHEVWHNGTQVRLVLIVDVWHPDLTEEERLNLSPI